MAKGFPDWTRTILMLGQHLGDFVAVAVDENGVLYSVFKGEDGAGELRNIAVDNEGQIITVPRGEGGNYLAVDENGYLTIVTKGTTAGGVLKSVLVDASGQIIMVPRGATGNYLTVDEDGYLATVIKGDYLGDLKTVRVDAEGRLSAFIIDSTDAWGNMLSVGNAELAARLGSPVCFDRRGTVQYTDDFAQGKGCWAQGLYGTGASVATDPLSFYKSGYSVRLTGGSTGSHQASMFRYIPFLATARAGFEVAFSIYAAIDRVSLGATVYTGTTYHTFRFRYDSTNGNFDVLTGPATYTTFVDDAALYHEFTMYNVVKVVADFTTDKYVRVLANGIEYDVSAYSVDTGANANPPRFDLSVTAFSRLTFNDWINVGQVVATNQEP